MTATPPQVLGDYLPVVPPPHGQMVVSDGPGHGLSRQKHYSAERILSGELLPRQKTDSSRTSFSNKSTITVSPAPLTVRPPDRAIAAYSENARAARSTRPRIDLRV